MKKFFSLIAASLVAMTMSAQSVSFAHADGTVVENGSTLTMSTLEDSGFGYQIPLEDIGILNGNAAQEVILRLSADEIPSGDFQCCFPSTCQMLQAGTALNLKANLKANELKMIKNTEWMVVEEEYGTTTVKFELVVDDEVVSAITIDFVYSDPAGINNVEANANTNAPVYNIAGQRVNAGAKGLLIKNGKKILVK